MQNGLKILVLFATFNEWSRDFLSLVGVLTDNPTQFPENSAELQTSRLVSTSVVDLEPFQLRSGKYLYLSHEQRVDPSKDFYSHLENSGRLQILDGYEIFEILRLAYRKAYILPSNIELQLETKPIHKDNVYVGFVSASELKKHYEKFGDAIFLENIRDFLGPKSGRQEDRNRKNRTSVNEALFETAKHEPEKMLARNNGITFRAAVVRNKEDNPNTLILETASIVNGCQTTMALVKNVSPRASVLVKIVQTDDSWDIAKSANFQNEVKQIELDLARFIRPQTVKEAATRYGITLQTTSHDILSNSIVDVLNAVYQDRITYHQVYTLFIGIFSRNINNIFNPNYTELRYDILNQFTFEESSGKTTYQFLIDLIKTAEQARERVQGLRITTTDNLLSEFQRFFNEENSRYHAFLTILAACCSVRKNIYELKIVNNFQDLSKFFDDVRSVIENDTNQYTKTYIESFKTIMNCVVGSNKDPNEIKQNMANLVKQLKFNNLFSMTLSSLDLSSF